MNCVAITQRVISEVNYNERRDALDQRWYSLLYSLGYIPLALPNNAKVALKMLVKLRPQGLILSGGNSLCQYGGDAPERDDTEFKLLEYAIHNELPTLGVCRGMQLIQAYFGIPLELVSGHVTKTMKIMTYNDKSMTRNSFHDYGTRINKDCFEVIAKSEDGIIKAIKHRDYNLQGVMWHPERELPLKSEDVELISKVFN